jgi:transposase
LSGFVRERPDATLEELRQRIASELGIRISIGALWETLRRMEFTFKTSRRTPASSHARTCGIDAPAGTTS